MNSFNINLLRLCFFFFKPIFFFTFSAFFVGAFFFSFFICMKDYIYTIADPLQPFRDPGPLWVGGVLTKRIVFVCCRATLTHSRALASNSIQCMCHPR